MFSQGIYLSTDLLYNIYRVGLEIIERKIRRVNEKCFLIVWL